MVDKCSKFRVKNILIFGLIFNARVLLELLEKIHEKLSTFCFGYGLIYIDYRNIRGIHLCQDNLHLLQSCKKVLCNIANNTTRSVILEIKNDRCKIVKILIFHSLSQEHFKSK